MMNVAPARCAKARRTQRNRNRRGCASERRIRPGGLCQECDCSDQPPLQIRSCLHSLRPMHFVAIAGPPMPGPARRARLSFFQGQRVGWEASPFALADLTANFCRVAPTFQSPGAITSPARLAYRCRIDCATGYNCLMIVGRHRRRDAIEWTRNKTAFRDTAHAATLCSFSASAGTSKSFHDKLRRAL